MTQLIVRRIEEKIVRNLKEQAGFHGVSTEEEHRNICDGPCSEPAPKGRSFKQEIRRMPNVGKDSDFQRKAQINQHQYECGVSPIVSIRLACEFPYDFSQSLAIQGALSRVVEGGGGPLPEIR
jgi:plasmid stability protein